MSKEIESKIRAYKCGKKNCACVTVEINDFLQGKRKLESFAIKHKVAHKKLKPRGNDGVTMG